MAETLEDKVNANLPQQEKKEEKPVGIFRSALEETVQLFRTATNLTVGTMLPAVADAAMGGFGSTATSAGLYFGSVDRSSRSFRNKGIIGTLFAIFANYTFTPLSNLNPYARAAAVPAWQAAANAYYIPLEHTVEKKTLTGIVERFKNNYKKITKKAILYLSPLAFATTYLPLIWQVPALAAQAFIFKKVVAPDEKIEPTDKTHYLVAASNVVKKGITNTFKGIYETLDALVATAKDYMKAPAKITPEPKPA